MEAEGILTQKQYGRIILKLYEIRRARNLSKNKLINMMGVNYGILLRYCNNNEFGLVDFDFLARACYVLKCDIADIVEYRQGNQIK